jgi:MSHA biogenesis protein MshP
MIRQPASIIRAIRRSAGVGLVTAIFLLVVLAGLGTAMVTVFTSQQATSALDEQGARAYQAARAGVEWALYMQTQAGGCPGLNATTAASTTSFPLPANTSLAGFFVTVTCTRLGAAGDPLARFVIRATACKPSAGSCPNWSNNPDYVQRVVEVEI